MWQKNTPHKHKIIFKIMTDISKNAELQQSCITAVIPRSFFVFVQVGTDEYRILAEGIDTYDEAIELKNIYKPKFKNPPFVVAFLNE